MVSRLTGRGDFRVVMFGRGGLGLRHTVLHQLHSDFVEDDPSVSLALLSSSLTNIKLPRSQSCRTIHLILFIDLIEFFLKRGNLILQIQEYARMQIVKGTIEGEVGFAGLEGSQAGIAVGCSFYCRDVR